MTLNQLRNRNTNKWIYQWMKCNHMQKLPHFYLRVNRFEKTNSRSYKPLISESIYNVTWLDANRNSLKLNNHFLIEHDIHFLRRWPVIPYPIRSTNQQICYSCRHGTTWSTFHRLLTRVKLQGKFQGRIYGKKRSKNGNTGYIMRLQKRLKNLREGPNGWTPFNWPFH